MAAIPTSIAPRIGALIRMLSSPIDNEALAAARGLTRTLGGVGLSLHDLAAAVEQPRKARAPRAPRAQPAPPQAPPGNGMVWSLDKRITIARALRRGITGGLLTAWETQFATDVIGQIMSASRPRNLTTKQAATVNSLLIKITEVSQ